RLSRIESFVVHRDGYQPRGECPEHRRDDRVARILDTDRVIRIQQHADREVESVLNSRDDDDLVGRAREPPRLRQTRGGGLAERPVRAGVAARQQSPTRATKAPGGDLGPGCAGKLVRGGYWRQGTGRLGIRRARRLRQPARKPGKRRTVTTCLSFDDL